MEYKIKEPEYPSNTGCGNASTCATKEIMQSSEMQNKINNLTGGSSKIETEPIIPNVVGASEHQNKIYSKLAELSVTTQENSKYDKDIGMKPLKGGKNTRRKTNRKKSLKKNRKTKRRKSMKKKQIKGKKIRRTRKKKAGTIKEMAKKFGKGLYKASKYPYRQLHKGVLRTISDGEFDEREAKRQKLREIEYAKEVKEKKEKQEVIKKKLEESLKKIEEKGLIRVKKVDELKKSKKYVQLDNYTTEGEIKELGEFRGLQRHPNPRPDDYDYPYSLYFEKDTIKKGSPKSSAKDLDLTHEGIYMYSDKAAFEQGINTQLKLIDENQKELAPTPQAKVLERPEIRYQIKQFMRGGRRTRKKKAGNPFIGSPSDGAIIERTQEDLPPPVVDRHGTNTRVVRGSRVKMPTERRTLGGKRKTKKFKKHYMWNTKGKRYMAKTYKQHLRGVKLGHTHKKPKKSKRRTKKRGGADNGNGPKTIIPFAPKPRPRTPEATRVESSGLPTAGVGNVTHAVAEVDDAQPVPEPQPAPYYAPRRRPGGLNIGLGWDLDSDSDSD